MQVKKHSYYFLKITEREKRREKVKNNHSLICK